MTPEEVKDKLKSVINSLIKDQPDEASKDLHDVLAAKMRDRINPEAAAEATSAADDSGEGEVEVDDDEGEGTGDHPPGEHDPRDPGTCIEPCSNQCARHLKEKISQKEHPCSGTENLRRQPRQILLHRHAGIGYIHTIQISNDRYKKYR